MVIVKVSVCLFLLRMVQKTNSTVKWLVGINLIFLVPFSVAAALVNLFQCTPMGGYWNRQKPAKCMAPNSILVIMKIMAGILSRPSSTANHANTPTLSHRSRDRLPHRHNPFLPNPQTPNEACPEDLDLYRPWSGLSVSSGFPP